MNIHNFPYYRRRSWLRRTLILAGALAIGLGAYCFGMSHSQAETLAARSETDRAYKLTANALQEMDRTENKLALIRENLPWFLDVAEQIQRAELEMEIENNQKRRES